MWKLATVAACSIACIGSYAAAQSAKPDTAEAKASIFSMQNVAHGLREVDSAVSPRSGSGSAFAVTEELSAVQKGLPACACVRGVAESQSPDAAVVGVTRNLKQGAPDESKSVVSLISSFIAGAESNRGPGVSTVSAFASETVSAEMAASNPNVNTP